MFSTLDDAMFILPVCYHPTTILSVDDDKVFLSVLSTALSDHLSLLCFDDPIKATDYTKSKHAYHPFTERCLKTENNTTLLDFVAIRNEIYNADRFKEIFISVTDYDMPHKDGIELIRTMEFQPEVFQYSHIILTGKISNEFKEKLVGLGLSGEYIGKDDPQYIAKLLDLIEKRLTRIFQWYSYIPARMLSKNAQEQTSILFDVNIATLFNQYIQKHNMCEMYLFDQQGSYLLLDQEANLNWFFVRNEMGMENSIKIATQYGASPSVLNALKERKYILSLYEKNDIEARQGKINWDDYLLPANLLASKQTASSFLPGLKPADHYYYAFSPDFPDHGIDRKKILSYADFLRT